MATFEFMLPYYGDVALMQAACAASSIRATRSCG